MEYYDDCSTSSSSSEEHSLVPGPSSASSLSHVSTPSPKRKAGRKKFKETRHPVYRGVRERKSGKWVCEVREPNKKSRIWLGTYPTAEMAARAHDVAAIALRGNSAALNFKDSAWVLPRARSASSDDIRHVALEAAEMFGPSPLVSSVLAVNEQVVESRPPVGFVDEEAMFNMPGLLKEMGQGLMLSPLDIQLGYGWDVEESHIDMCLWSY